jgi:aminoglycoside phosphotransferase family enzyme/predicted kinase
MVCAAWREALHEPATYPEPTSTVEVRETHISLVFLTDHYAYKVKKPVNLGFLDFSTLEQRRFFCEQELALNRRLSSDVYLEVVALHQDGNRYSFDGHGPVVEYALKMRRLPADCSLQALLRHGKDSSELMETLAQHLAVFHHAHPLPATTDYYGSLAHVQEDWTENFAQTAEHIGHTLSQHTYDRVQCAVHTFMTQHAAWFAQRVENGCIRDGHGDLRAEHVYYEWERGQLQIIDCIEFNQRFRYIDVASDIAFLAMDLERLGAPDMAHHFVRAYVQAAGDVPLYRLLDFYRCYRAYVRGKVTSMRLHTVPPEKREPLRQQAESYFIMAARYAARCTQPLLLLTAGLIASGKSTVAEGVAAVLDLELFSSDRVRKELAGVPPQASQRAAYGQGLYSATDTQRTYEALAALARHSLQQGHAVVLDASFAKRAERQRLAAIAQEVGAHCCLLECRAPESVIRARLRAREQSTGMLSDAREDILTQFQRDYEPIQESEFACHVRLETTQSIEHCVQQALAAIQFCPFPASLGA